MNRLVALAALLLTTAAAQSAGAACGNILNACDYSSSGLAACCGSTTCVLAGTVTVPNGQTCTIDFGARDVEIQNGGTLQVGTANLTVLAGALKLSGNGKITALGDATTLGGTVTLGTAGRPLTSFTMKDVATVDVSGGGVLGGGDFLVTASGIIDVQAGTISANALATAVQASGGAVKLASLAGDVNLNGSVLARANTGATSSGGGGSVEIDAFHNFSLRNGRAIDVRGALASGGTIDIQAGSAVMLETLSTMDASSYPSTEGDGGMVQIFAATVDALGTIFADGGSSLQTSDGGGSGGEIDIEATSQHLRVAHATKGLSANGSQGADGGSISLLTDSPTVAGATPGTFVTDGTLTVSAAMSAQGSSTLDSIGGGGEVLIQSTGDFILMASSPINVDGGGDLAGTVEIDALRDATINSTISGDSDAGGGAVTVDVKHDVTFNGDVSLNGSPGVGGEGGSIDVSAGNDIRVSTGSALETIGATTDAGGRIDMRAGRRLLVDTQGVIAADGGANAGAVAGQVTLFSNSDNLGSPPNGAYGTDPDFDMIIAGKITAVGNNACSGTPSQNVRGRIDINGCRVRLNGGTLDSRGDCYASNTITVRQGISISAQSGVRSTVGSGSHAVNALISKDGVSLSGIANGATVTPAFTKTTAPECTAVNTPAGCVVPCPTCGDGVITGPWETCDVPDGSDRCGTGCAHCRLETCGSGNPCQSDACDSLGGCVNAALPDGTTCDDGSVCTPIDTCQNGSCQHTTLTCDDGNPCTLNQCNPVSGCTFPNQDGIGISGCDDGQFCNGDEACAGGTCVVGTPPTCADLDPNTQDFCDPSKNKCVNQFTPCTSVADCNDHNDCTNDTCVPAQNQAGMVCQNTPVTNGIGCDDGNACTVGDSCQNGACVRGADKSCNDGLVCTIDSCDTQTGCHNDGVGGDCCENDAGCNDGNVCTVDTCNGQHVCEHAAVDQCCTHDEDCDDGEPCTQEQSGICDTTTDPQAPHCNDAKRFLLSGPQTGCGDACTPGQCTPGNGTSTCVLGDPVQCQDDNDICTVEVCDATLGCQHQPIAGCCTTAADCADDGNTCTTTVCNEAHTCENQLRFPDCKPCSKDTDCDELGRCAGAFCDGTGACQTTTPTSCSDGNVNTTDVCFLDDALQPSCRHACLNAAACSDGDACNGIESCNVATGACSAGTPPTLDDGDSCTDDSCDAAAGVQHAQKTGFERILCRLDEIEQRVGAASATDLNPRVQKSIAHLLVGIRTKLAKAKALKDQNRASFKKPLKVAVAQTKKIDKLTVRLRGKKIAATLADTLHTGLLDVIGQEGSQLP